MSGKNKWETKESKGNSRGDNQKGISVESI